LAFLKELQLIQSQGNGKNTIHTLSQEPFLRFIDSEEYFKDNSQIRVYGLKTFNMDIVDNLKRAFSNSSIILLFCFV